MTPLPDRSGQWWSTVTSGWLTLEKHPTGGYRIIWSKGQRNPFPWSDELVERKIERGVWIRPPNPLAQVPDGL